MPVLTGALIPEGALVNVLVGPSHSTVQGLRTTLRPVPPFISTKALLDTGAEMTCFDASLVQALGLPFGGSVPANVPAQGGLSFSALHDASLTIVHPSGKAGDNLVIRDITVLELALASLGYQVLIGRDVLARCRFLYDGPKNRFRLHY
jgi:hypothetical protein